MSKLRVLKFGGSSVASPEHIHRVANIVVSHFKETKQVVVVVSAMGKSTDDLLKLATQVSPHAKVQHKRELDMLVSVGERISMSLLSMAIRDHGIEAVSLTGSQSGIVTNESHGEAQILEIKGDRIQKALAEEKVVIVAGFQGVSREKEITTLGRGGSDTTALALAVFLKASNAFIYSDVDAYYSADPKLYPQAKRYNSLPWEIAVLSSFYGAKVLHYRAVELAAKHKLEIHLLSTSYPHGFRGLVKGSVEDNMEEIQMLTINIKKGLRKLTTKNCGELERDTFSELEGLLTAPLAGIKRSLSTSSKGEVFEHFGENLERHQEGVKTFSFSHDEVSQDEFWCLTLVGTGLHHEISLLNRANKILEKNNISLESYSWTPLTLSLTIKAQPEKEKILIAEFHQEFIK